MNNTFEFPEIKKFQVWDTILNFHIGIVYQNKNETKRVVNKKL